MGANNNTGIPQGPALGNVALPDSYIRIKQNIDALNNAVLGLNSRIDEQGHRQVIVGGNNVRVFQNDKLGQTVIEAYGSSGNNNSGVASVNGLGGPIIIVAGNNMNVSVAGNNITVSFVAPGPWNTYTPTSTNLTTPSNASGHFVEFGSICFFDATITGQPTVTGNSVTIDLPTGPAAGLRTFPVELIAGNTQLAGVCGVSGTVMVINMGNGVPFPTTPITFTVAGSYQI